ncbi:alpha/beta fold hydrolase [Nocardioides jiangxiensis]|uniref:Alpha/beta fold hydrolase n=1 Tax=Nocardioides jiangxiensis TaxID=3064524 RepID=A0ABT9AZM3_9ACTN|nr:alpha/beta fold hydrolase [Nocardioides sp. WY-20]MDO7867910.1 alpha/beta fold hydrolase [Nocardioides sp. WY-20]
MATPRQRTLTTSDGVRLAVQEHGDPAHPTVVAIHGYPDDHHVWDGVVAALVDRFHVVTYDVRGAGSSESPSGRRHYTIPRLAADLGEVIDGVVGDRQVHLLAHDWGSIQTWALVTDPAWADRLLSYTSVSGPDLDMVGVWLRGVRERPRAIARQLLDSYYIALFQLPLLPEAAIRLGVLDRLVRHSARHGLSADAPVRDKSRSDAERGLALYRANFLPRLARPAPRRTTVPVQVLAPTGDLHVDSETQRTAPAPWCDSLATHEVEGNHWVVEHSPALVAAHVSRFVDENSGKADRPLF